MALERVLGVDHGLAGHGRPCPGGRGVVVRAVEGELSGLLHVELAPAGDSPGQLLTADAALDRRATGIVRARGRHERRRQVARLIRSGKLQNARFAAAVIVRGKKQDRPIEVRFDATFPSLYQIRLRGLALSPISYATAQMASLFIKYFPRDSAGVFPPGSIPLENRQAIFRDLKSRDILVTSRTVIKKSDEDDEEFL